MQDHANMNSILDKAVNRFKDLDEEDRGTFKKLLVEFRNLYGFLSQVIPYQDSDLEKLYTYIRFLLPKLPRRQGDPIGDIENEVELQYYRLQKISEGSIILEPGKVMEIPGPTQVGTRKAKPEEIELSQLIDILNDRFGTEFRQGLSQCMVPVACQVLLDPLGINDPAVAKCDADLFFSHLFAVWK